VYELAGREVHAALPGAAKVAAGHAVHAAKDVAPSAGEKAPPAHSVQFEEPTVALHVPAGHKLQAVAPGCEYAPAGQAVHDAAPDEFEKNPAAQLAQRPPMANVPGGHEEAHAAAPARLKRPGGQGVHVAADVAPTAAEKVEAGQSWQAATCVGRETAEYEPAAQGTHALCSGRAAKKPGAQSEHVSSPGLAAKVPGAHSAQLVDLVVLAKRPLGHRRHASADVPPVEGA
jgi:hypothetical protein